MWVQESVSKTTTFVRRIFSRLLKEAPRSGASVRVDVRGRSSSMRQFLGLLVDITMYIIEKV